MVAQQEIMLDELKSSFPLTIEEFLRTAILITEMVQQLHQKNGMIGVLHPGNIKINHEHNIAKLMESLKWNEAYRAPEYSSAIQYTPNKKSDLYSLGVIFYEMLTGELPIHRIGVDQDWFYAHQVVTPPLLTEYRSDISDTIHRIVIKLLNKSPEDRYDSSYGLLADLRRCESTLKKDGKIETFDIGQLDIRSRYRFPSALIGRESELAQLLDSYEQATQGQFALVSIRGDQGTGKTILLDSFLTTIPEDGALLLRAECKERPDASLPLILEAIFKGFERLWSEETEKIEAVRKCLQREFGEQDSLMWSMMPAAAAYLKLNPKNKAMQVTDQHIMELAVRLLRCLVTYQKPLVLAIDGLQWADSSTLHTLKQLSLNKELTGVMIIGISRTEDQRFHSYLDELNHSSLVQSKQMTFIDINPFTFDEVRTLLSVVVHEDSKRVSVLARIAYDLTAGNVYKLKMLLEQWHTLNKFIYDEILCCWTWEEILHEQTTELVSDSLPLYEAAFQRLSEQCQALLIIASAIGVKFELTLLSEVCNYSLEQTLSLLHLAEKEGIVCREDDGAIGNMKAGYYLFMNKQLQVMLYRNFRDASHIWHYKIGAAYLYKYERVHDIKYSLQAATHWNRAIEHLSDIEKYRLAVLNLNNAKWGNLNKKHAEAVSFAEAGIKLLDVNNFPIATQCDYYFELALAEYMLGNVDKFDLHIKFLSKYLDQLNKKDRIRLIVYQIEIHTFTNNKEAIKLGLSALSEFDWELPSRVTTSMLIAEVVKTQVALRKIKSSNRSSNRKLRINNDTDYELFSLFMVTICMPLIFEEPIKAVYLFAKYLRYSLKQGMNEYALGILAIYELILQRGMTSIYKLLPSDLLPYLEEKSLANGLQSYRLPLINGMYYQLNHPTISASYITQTIRRSIEHRDLIMANFSMLMLLNAYYGNIHEFQFIQSYMNNEAREFVDEKTSELLSIVKAYCTALQDEGQFEKYVEISDEIEQSAWNTRLCEYKLEVSYYAGKYKEALIWADRSKKLEVSYDLLNVRKTRLFEALSAAALYESADYSERIMLTKIVSKLSKAMKSWNGFWGKDSPAHVLIQAENRRIAGKDEENVIAMYKLAIMKAKEENYSLIEAIAGERLYDYLEQINKASVAALTLLDACSAYKEWGIEVKFNQLRRKYPNLCWYYATKEIKNLPDQLYSTEVAATVEYTMEPEAINQDHESTILKMMRSLCDDKNTAMLEQCLESMVCQLGASRGSVIAVNDNKYNMVKSVGRQLPASFALIPESISRYAYHTGQPLILSDVAKSSLVKDHYLEEVKPQSVLCMPIVNEAEGTTWLIYVENTELVNIFSERSINTLELLLTRLAHLYETNTTS